MSERWTDRAAAGDPGFIYGGTRKEREAREACLCAPCCECGYAGQDSDGADCYGKKGRNVLKGGVRFYGPHCFCWHASEADCPVHGSPESGEALADLEPCPNSPFRLEGGSGPVSATSKATIQRHRRVKGIRVALHTMGRVRPELTFETVWALGAELGYWSPDSEFHGQPSGSKGGAR